MEKRVVLSLGHGSLQTGFPAVTAQLWEQGDPHPMKFRGALPAAPEIPRVYRAWQLLYRAMHHRLNWHPRMEIETADVTNVSEVEFEDLCRGLALQINAWMSASEFRASDQSLRTHLDTHDEICLVVETDDDLLQRLPWHLWHFFDAYPRAEVALSPSSYQRASRALARTSGNRIKILVVLGSSAGIDVERDHTYLSQLSDQAEVSVLAEPSLEALTHALWQGCDLLFFAGHSSSREQGELQLNAHQSLTLEQLKYGLRGAIAHGLKLAIFNSCDGLGLARSLADLSIPQVIVMREPVPDQVAQAFLKHFLSAFTQNQSLYASVRAAREQLQGLEADYPCASWLPAIYQNPAESSTTWRQWQVDKAPAALPRVPRRMSLAKGLRSVVLSSLIVTALILGGQQLGWLQPWELRAYDQLMRLRPVEAPDPRLLIVAITEEDFDLPQQQSQREGSLSNLALVQLLSELETLNPVAVGLDIYRPSPASPELASQLSQSQNLYAVCKASDATVGIDGIQPPAWVPPDRHGFSDLVKDPDNVLRRHLIAMGSPNPPCTTPYALSSQLVLRYLESKEIVAEWTSAGALKVGEVLLRPLQPNSGGYRAADTQGLQVLLNYRNTPSPLGVAPIVTLSEALGGAIAKEQLQNRIVLIGVMAESSGGDFETTPYGSLQGVVVQAHMLSQILSAVEEGRPLLSTWSLTREMLWIWTWAAIGGALSWYFRWRLPLALAVGGMLAMLCLCCFLLFIQGIWVPLIPAGLALPLTAGAASAFYQWRPPFTRLPSSAPNSPGTNKP